MAIRKLNPYLNFPGTARKAIQLYEKALGAKSDNVMPWQDMPGQPPNPEAKDRIMHAVLHIDDGMLMLSDTPPGVPAAPGSNVSITLDFDDATDMARKFEALSTGGKITMPLQDTFWGAKFGMLTDALGVQWMFNCQAKTN